MDNWLATYDNTRESYMQVGENYSGIVSLLLIKYTCSGWRGQMFTL